VVLGTTSIPVHQVLLGRGAIIDSTRRDDEVSIWPKFR
jgi:hypothetical protein